MDQGGCGLSEGLVLAQACESHKGSLVRRQFAAEVTLTGDDEHRDPLDQGMREVECGRIGNLQAPGSAGRGFEHHPNGSGALEVAGTQAVTGSMPLCKAHRDHQHRP
jgi:hypothetical protein